MKSKVNNSFKEEYKDIPLFIRKIKKTLKVKRKSSVISFTILSAIIALTNIAILIIASIALDKVIYDYNHTTKVVDFTSSVLPTILVSVVSIATFILSLIIAIYQGKMKSNTYKMALEKIQYTYVLMKRNNEKDTEIIKEVNNIYHDATSSKKKVSFKKTLVNILTGGSDE